MSRLDFDTSAGGSGSTTITGALPAGTNVIGGVQVVDGTTTTQKLAVSASGVASVAVASALPAGANLIGNTGVAQSTAIAGIAGELAQGSVTTSSPAYTAGNINPLSLTPAGCLRVNVLSSGGTVGLGIDAAGSARIGAIYNTVAPTLANTVAGGIQLDARSSLYVDAEGRYPTYSASASIVLGATPTDVFTIYGSASTVIRIRRIEIDGLATTAGGLTGTLTKRSAVNTGGTSSAVTAVPHDSGDGAATGTCLAYTANPSGLGTAVGAIRTFNVPFPLIASAVPPVVFDFGARGADKCIVLTGVAQGLVVNLGGGTAPIGGAAQISIEWTEI